MTSQPQKFKDTTLFDWDAEPSRARGESLFTHESDGRRARRYKRQETKLALWLGVTAVALAVGLVAILAFARFVHIGHV